MKTKNISRIKKQLSILRTLAVICHPTIITFVGFLWLFTFSYLAILPIAYKTIVLAMVFCFTILIPLAGIFFYSRTNHLDIRKLGNRRNRSIIYMLTLFPYAACLYLLYKLNMPGIMTGILITAIATLVVNTIINLFWKISIHMAGMGLLIGIIIAFSPIYHINPVLWLSLIILLTGTSGTCSILCKLHTLPQVLAGVSVGLSCGLLGQLFI